MIIFNTTSMNTGKIYDIVILSQRQFSQKCLKELQFISCQHHIPDRVLRVVMDNDLREKMLSPNIEYTFIPKLLSDSEKLQANFSNGEEKTPE
ncbi:Hypothetical predicted protein [Octopus vulgaris]|uniref:Uncharacterized protein n=1 Tax=Octopus vulgaris TaxID=6645 RepID=A0AA36EYM9_OCTVU|nr:Hypothetical predicted protein [Octopus vulgaris]